MNAFFFSGNLYVHSETPLRLTASSVPARDSSIDRARVWVRVRGVRVGG